MKTAPRSTSRIVFAALLSGFVGGLDATALFFVYPDIRDGLAGGDEGNASWVLSITSVVGAAVLLQAGRLADRFGPHRLYFAGAVVYTVGAVAVTLSPTIWTLVGARGVQSAGAALLGPAALALILADAPDREQAAAAGRWGMWTAVSGVIGPIIAAVLIDAVSWRLMFATQIVCGVAMAFFGRPDPAAPQPAGAGELRPADSVITAVALALLVLPIVEGNDWGWTSGRTITVLAFAVVLLATVVRRSLRQSDPVVPLALFRQRTFALAAAISASAGILFFAQWLAFLLFLTEVWGYGLIRSALVLTIMPGSMWFVAVRAGRIADRLGHRRVILPGAGAYTVVLAVFVIGADDQPNLPLLLPALVFAGLAMAAIWPTLTALAVNGVSPERLGTATATVHTVQRIGAALGVALIVAIVSRSFGDSVFDQHRAAVLLLPIAGGITAVLAAFIPRPDRLEEGKPQARSLRRRTIS